MANELENTESKSGFWHNCIIARGFRFVKYNKAKKLRMTQDGNDAKYKFILKVANVDRFFAAMAFIPQHEAKMWGTLTIVDMASGQTLAVVEIEEAEDGQHVDIKYCYGETFEELGQTVAKMK